MSDTRRCAARLRCRAAAVALICWLALLPGAEAALNPFSTTIVSAPHGGFGIIGPATDGELWGKRSVSGDGRYVLFRSRMRNLVAGTPAGYHLYRWDRLTGSYVLVDRSHAGTPGPGGVGEAAMTPDGRYVAFQAVAPGLVPATEGSSASHVYLRDLEAGTTVLVSRANGSAGAVGEGFCPSIGVEAAADARDPHVVVAFCSRSRLASNDDGDVVDVYVRDVTAATTELISAGAVSGRGGSHPSVHPQISGDGRFVVFASLAQDLVGGVSDGDQYQDVFRHDRAAAGNATQELTAVANGHSGHPDVSRDGSVVVFDTTASNFAGATDTNATSDVVRWQAGTVGYVSANGGSTGNAASEAATVSASGQAVAFMSQANDLGPAVPDGGHRHAYVRTPSQLLVVDRPSGASTSVPPEPVGNPHGANMLSIALAGDGSAVAFTSDQDALTDADDSNPDAFLRVLAADTLLLVSAGPGASGLDDSWVGPGSVSRDGRFVAFSSAAPGLAPAGVDIEGLAYVKDMLTGDLTLVSRSDADGAPTAAGGPQVGGDGARVAWRSGSGELYVRDIPSARTIPVTKRPGDPWSAAAPGSFSISADGRFVAFATRTALLADDTNSEGDVYVRDVDSGELRLASRGDGEHGPAAGGDSALPQISDDGSRVAFQSRADLGEGAGRWVVYVRDLLSHRTFLASRDDGPDGARPDEDIDNFALSGDGKHLAFDSIADNVGASDDGREDLFVRRLAAGRTETVLDQPLATENNGFGQYLEISDDGRYVLFAYEGELVAADTHPGENVYLADTRDGSLQLIDRADGPDGAVRNDAIDNAWGFALSGHGRCVAFTTRADNMVPGMPVGQDHFRVWLRALDGCLPAPPQPLPQAPLQASSEPLAADLVAPELTRVSLSRRTFTPAARRKGELRGRRGTEIRFTLSEPAQVRFSVLRLQRGRRVGRRCVRPTGSNRRRRACTRQLLSGKFSRRAAAGAQSVEWNGWIDRRKLRPGTHRLALQPVDDAGNVGRTVAVRFRVVRRQP